MLWITAPRVPNDIRRGHETTVPFEESLALRVQSPRQGPRVLRRLTVDRGTLPAVPPSL